MKKRSLFTSFDDAINGIIYAIKTQRNFKLHCLAALTALGLSLFYGFSRLELLILLITITLVMMAELINTAIEKVVDMIIGTYHPLARIAKDVAAGAVLITAFNAVFVGYILFFTEKRFIYTFENLLKKIQNTPFHMAFFLLIIVLGLVFIIKICSKKGTLLRGGVVSGHAAIAFSVSTFICLMIDNVFVAMASLMLSALVAQSRVEGKIHTNIQVVLGAFLGSTVVLFLYVLFFKV